MATVVLPGFCVLPETVFQSRRSKSPLAAPFEEKPRLLELVLEHSSVSLKATAFFSGAIENSRTVHQQAGLGRSPVTCASKAVQQAFAPE